MDLAIQQATTNGIELVMRARQVLAEARDLDDVKDVRDRASALAGYLRQRGESHEAQNIAAEIKIRAERRAGELLREMEKAVNQHSASNSVLPAPTLADLGIVRMTAHRWQTVAGMDEGAFERYIEETKDKGADLTSAGAYRTARRLEATAPEGPGPWTFDDATFHLWGLMKKVVARWPSEAIHVLPDQLRCMAEEIEETGGLRP